MEQGIELTVVGCSGSTSGPDSPASSYLVSAPWQGRRFTVLLDCGPGAFGALYRRLDDLREIDAIALSHLHPDHCLDLCAWYVAARYSPTAPWPRLDLHGPPGTLERLGRAYEPGPGRTADLRGAFEERGWLPEQQIGPFTVRTARVAHPAPCWATRFETEGAALVYSGDTGPTEALTALARGADLLLCEAAFADPAPADPPNPAGLHLTGGEAGRIAADARVGRLVITHVPPWHDPGLALAAAGEAFGGPTDLAVPGARWAVAAGRGASARLS